ncbi:MAG: UDP-N-acetylglucosamine 2-epimerase (non-hydrolyzing) [Candidatus Bathyarchaeia archaeon]|jgi:UDP-N-acetylglucosamine 2-epimerase
MSVFLILGTRPQIIKSVPIVQEALKQGLVMQIIHTGQHYNPALSNVFFEELSLQEPFANLNVRSGSHIYQIAEIMLRLEKRIVEEKPSVVLVPGDTNSALAGAIASVKLGIHLAHLESGARSYDMKMAEEINRRLIDHCAQTLFAPTSNCKKNLEEESVTGTIYQTGDTMFDVFVSFKDKADKSDITSKLDLTNEEYAILTAHRAENVDDPAKLKRLLQAIQKAEMPVIFPIHPRTKERLKDNGISLDSTNIRTIDPVGYIEMLALLKNAKVAITDSGGLQKEAFWSKTPCITTRDRTEWTETVNLGVNFITDVDPAKITQALKYIQDNYSEIRSRFTNNPFGEGNASKKIVKILKEKFYCRN